MVSLVHALQSVTFSFFFLFFSLTRPRGFSHFPSPPFFPDVVDGSSHSLFLLSLPELPPSPLLLPLLPIMTKKVAPVGRVCVCVRKGVGIPLLGLTELGEREKKNCFSEALLLQ